MQPGEPEDMSMGSRSSTSAHMARRFLASGLIMILMIVAMPAFATPMDDYIKLVNETCEKFTQEKERLTRLSYQKGAKATEDTAERMAKVSRSVAQAQKLIGEKPPQTPDEQKEFVDKVNGLLNAANKEITDAQRQLGVQLGAIHINPQDLMQRFPKGFDGNATSSDATPVEVDIERRRDTNFFFDVNGCKADANRRAKAGAVAFSNCAACKDHPEIIEQHLAELERLHRKDLADCERGLTPK